jgi:hypothetical protein
MRWWIGCLIRELPPLTVNAPAAWHVCGTRHACRGEVLSRARDWRRLQLLLSARWDPVWAVRSTAVT